MIRINLLPHREEKRKARRQQFVAFSGATLLLGALIVGLVNGVISGYVSAQDEKNAFLKTEIAVLDKSIDEIKRLREQTDALIQRKQVIDEVGTLSGIESVFWSTRSTLMLQLSEEANQQRIDEICAVVKHYEAIRTSRLHLQPPKGSEARVRFLQCATY